MKKKKNYGWYINPPSCIFDIAASRYLQMGYKLVTRYTLDVATEKLAEWPEALIPRGQPSSSSPLKEDSTV